jgi:hypothetical protein
MCLAPAASTPLSAARSADPHDREDFYIRNRSKSFAIMEFMPFSNPARIRDLSSLASG